MLMFMDMCMDMCTDMCIDMYNDTCIHIYVGMCHRHDVSLTAGQAAVSGGFITGGGLAPGEALVANPIRIGLGLAEPNEPPVGASGVARAPLLGEHTTAVLLGAGLSEARIAELRAAGAFGTAKPHAKL